MSQVSLGLVLPTKRVGSTRNERIARGMLRTLLLAFLLSGFAAVSGAYAETVGTGSELNLLTMQDSDPSVQGDQSLGDSVDLNTGSLSFTQTDISLPGNSTLEVAVKRRLDPARRQTYDSLSALPFYNWQLDLPRITATLATDRPWPANRCSTQWIPPTIYGPDAKVLFPYEYWHGFKIEFPGGSALLLRPTDQTFPRPSNFVSVAARNIGISCNSAIAPSGAPAGEGYTIWLPDGTHYDLNLYVLAPATGVSKLSGDDTGRSGFGVSRQIASMLITKATDRFGNFVTYSYDTNANLQTISASDGRQLTLNWKNVDGYTVINTVTDGSRTWTYGYAGGELSTVTRPDNSQWHFSMLAISKARPGDPQADYFPDAPKGMPATGSMTSPYGLTGIFTIDDIYHPHAAFPTKGIPNFFYVGGITKKQLSGPDLPTQTWSYQYHSGQGWYAADAPGAQTKNTEVTDPDRTTTRYTYNVNFDWRDGDLESVDIIPAGAATAIQTTTNTYEAAPFIGGSGVTYRNASVDAQARRLTGATISVNGAQYLTQYSSFDDYGNPTRVVGSNSVAYDVRSEARTYLNNNGTPWVIGQPLSVSWGGAEVMRTNYYPDTILPHDHYMFGVLKSTLNYWPDGTLQSRADALGHTTSFSNYFRGKPRDTLLPDGNAVHQAVNPTGSVASFTDARGNLTGFSYDGLNRLKSVTYPSGDSVAWTARNIVYGTLTAPELGLPAGTFRAQSTTGRMRRRTYFDASLNPLLVEELDTATSLGRYTRMAFDFAGRMTLKSYPSSDYSAAAGITNDYDALGRVRHKTTTDGTLLQTINYPQPIGFSRSGSQKRIIDASGNVTIISFQDFGVPDYSAPILVKAPESQTTEIDRDLFSHIQSVSQSGAGITATRSSVYDANYRLCKTIDPESGQSVIAYDNASRIAWTAKGQAGNPNACDYDSVPATARIVRDYDLLDRLKTVTYPDASGNIALGYDADGHLASANNPTARWTYQWNKRGLLDSEQAAIDGNSFTLDPRYDSLGHLASRLYPDNRTIAYAPDAWGQATQAGSYVSGIRYYPTGLPGDYSLRSGAVYHADIDSRMRLSSQTVTGDGLLQSLSYVYNDDSDLRSITDNLDGSDSATLDYDGLHRLKTASGLWGGYGYTYDALNNLQTRTGPNALNYNYDAATNRLSSITAGTSSGGSAGGTPGGTCAHTTTGGSTSGGTTTGGSTGGTTGGTSGGTTGGTTSGTTSGGSSGSTTGGTTTGGTTGGTSTGGTTGGTTGGGTTGGTTGGTSGGTGGVTGGTTGGVCSNADSPDAGCNPRVDPTSTSTNAAPPNALRTYAYDPIGRPYSDGSRSYSWNLADQITQISGVAAYGYDANGKRIKTTLQNGTVEYDLYDLQGQLVYSFKPALNKQTDFLNLAGKPLAELVNGIPTYLHPDLLGSPRLATSATKAIVWREHFDPYGQKLNSVNDRTGYTGHAYDQESGLTYAQARFYDPMVGRFLSTDPITFQDGDPGTFNRYAYVNDSPYNHTDPTGMACGTGSHIDGASVSSCSVTLDKSEPAKQQGSASAKTPAPRVMEKPFLPKGGMGQVLEDFFKRSFQIATLPLGGGVGMLGKFGEVSEAVEAVLAAEGGVKLTQEGIDAVSSHLSQFDEFAPNTQMVQRLQSSLDAGQNATGADANFFLHETSEANFMSQGLDYDAAHAASLDLHGASPFSLYHPEVIDANPSLFNNAWRQAAGLPPR